MGHWKDKAPIRARMSAALIGMRFILSASKQKSARDAERKNKKPKEVLEAFLWCSLTVILHG